MKRFLIQRGCVALLCLVAVLGFTGCTSDDDDPPDNIAGTWACTFSRAGEADKQETWNFVQSGQNITGSYTFGVNTWPFTGTYVDGTFTGIDTDGWPSPSSSRAIPPAAPSRAMARCGTPICRALAAAGQSK